MWLITGIPVDPSGYWAKGVDPTAALLFIQAFAVVVTQIMDIGIVVLPCIKLVAPVGLLFASSNGTLVVSVISIYTAIHESFVLTLTEQGKD